MTRASLLSLLLLSVAPGCTTPMVGRDAAAPDGGMDAFVAAPDATTTPDLGIDAPFTLDAPGAADATSTTDAPSAAPDGGSDAGHDGGTDAGHDGGHDACTPNPAACGNRCSGTAPDGCGGTLTCHASCGLDGACPCAGGTCGTGGFCSCRPPPCL